MATTPPLPHPVTKKTFPACSGRPAPRTRKKRPDEIIDLCVRIVTTRAPAPECNERKIHHPPGSSPTGGSCIPIFACGGGVSFWPLFCCCCLVGGRKGIRRFAHSLEKAKHPKMFLPAGGGREAASSVVKMRLDPSSTHPPLLSSHHHTPAHILGGGEVFLEPLVGLWTTPACPGGGPKRRCEGGREKGRLRLTVTYVYGREG